MKPVLAISNLRVDFRRPSSRQSTGPVTAAVREASLTVAPAECVGIVGESGSGKTQMFMAAMGLLGRNAEATGSVQFEGRELLTAPSQELNRVRGSKFTMVFQDPMTSLTPHLKIGIQLAEVLVRHARVSWLQAERAALEMLERARVPDARRRMRQYPHELSGGMRQRVMIGMSLLCGPKLLIADEPTSALDVTVQEQVLDLLRAMRREFGMAIVLISHDFGVVAGLADRILVMYAGRVVESAGCAALLQHAYHPYTAELLKCVPNPRGPRLARMPTLSGQPPDPRAEERGCAFAPRCPRTQDRCRTERPLLAGVGEPGSDQRASSALAACHYPVQP